MTGGDSLPSAAAGITAAAAICSDTCCATPDAVARPASGAAAVESILWRQTEACTQSSVRGYTAVLHNVVEQCAG